MLVCKYCQTELHLEGNDWLDQTEGDACSGDDSFTNENQPHQPEQETN